METTEKKLSKEFPLHHQKEENTIPYEKQKLDTYNSSGGGDDGYLKRSEKEPHPKTTEVVEGKVKQPMTRGAPYDLTELDRAALLKDAEIQKQELHVPSQKEPILQPNPVMSDYNTLKIFLLRQKDPFITEEEVIKDTKLKKKEALEYLKNNKSDMPQYLLDQLCNETYFDNNELRLLYRNFKLYSDENLFMTKEQFMKYFTPFSQQSELTKSLMMAIDKNGDEQIAFTEFVTALSVMCRGTRRERLRLTFQICDFNRDSLVSKSEVYQVIKTISDIFVKLGASRERFGHPHEVVESVFSGGLSLNGSTYIRNKNELNLKEFMDRGELDPDLAKCFGMFDYFYIKFVLPWEEIFKDTNLRLEGTLRKVKPLTVFKFNSVHKRMLALRDGFLIVYRKHFRGGIEKPNRVIFLPGSTVKVIMESHKSKFLSRKYHTFEGFQLTVGGYSRFFLLKNKEEVQEWINTIRFYSRIGYRYQSFAQPREHMKCEWFINGAAYYHKLAEALKHARHEIFITGWWVWPYVYLERSETDGPVESSRLDRLLTEVAKKGVKIYILMWNETNLGIQLGTNHIQRWFEGCHQNIHVIRHPRIYPLAWSHHQKCCVIDQNIAFLGGIDICGMRYETHRFHLVDLDNKLFPGRDYGNLMSICIRTGDPNKDQIDRYEMPRMPWHDVHVKMIGLAARDAGYNFIQRWNHAINTDRSNKHKPFLLPVNYELKEEPTKNNFKNFYSDLKRGVTHIGYGQAKPNTVNRPGDNPRVREDAQREAKRHPHDVFNNKIGSDGLPIDLEEYEEQKDRLDLKIEDQQKQSSLESPTTSTTASPATIPTPTPTGSTSVIHSYHMNGNLTPDCQIQIVRSACTWSVGTEVEDSCYKAYIALIKNAQHFIYIQNLYFISSCGAKLPKNRIALALLNRIRRAIIHKEDFRAIVLISVNPCGDILQASSRMVIGWTNRTIYQGGQSVLELLRAEFPDVDLNQYIGFFSLRQYEVSYDRIFTEQVYVHSKVMIIDDSTCIIGSCNINDRSMMGIRDSEIAAVISDLVKVDITMGGSPYRVGKFAHTLRVGLWKIHLGLSDSDVTKIIDPIKSQAFNDVWWKTAKSNSSIYKEVFGTGIPENQPHLGTPIKRYFPRTDEAVEKLSKISGVLIEYPLGMYVDADLFTSDVNVFTPEYYVDVSVFI
eukprot:gene14983-18143_t